MLTSPSERSFTLSASSSHQISKRRPEREERVPVDDDNSIGSSGRYISGGSSSDGRGRRDDNENIGRRRRSRSRSDSRSRGSGSSSGSISSKRSRRSSSGINGNDEDVDRRAGGGGGSSGRGRRHADSSRDDYDDDTGGRNNGKRRETVEGNSSNNYSNRVGDYSKRGSSDRSVSSSSTAAGAIVSDRLRYVGMTGAQIERARAKDRLIQLAKLTKEDYRDWKDRLQHLTVSRTSIKQAMGFAYDRIESSEEV